MWTYYLKNVKRDFEIFFIILGLFPRVYNTTKTKFEVVFYNEYSRNIELYWVDKNGIRNQYTSNVAPRSSRIMSSSYFHPWVFESTDNIRLRLFAYTANRNVSIFEGKDFGANNDSVLHVIINDQGNCQYF